jgi:hypothetical protein
MAGSPDQVGLHLKAFGLGADHDADEVEPLGCFDEGA